jgi:hypothetical protein
MCGRGMRKDIYVIRYFYHKIEIIRCSFFLPLGDASVCSEKMVAPGEKSFCALEYHTSKSVVTVRRAVRAKYAKDPPTDKTIHA